MPTYRAVPDDRIDAFRGILQYAFRPAEPPEHYDTVEELPGPARLGVRRGIFDGDDLLCTGVHHWFTATVRDTDLPIAGLSGVATPPENRHRGSVARLLRESLVEYRDEGSSLAALWPFDYAFYRRYGWAQAGTTATIECDPEILSFAADAAGGRFRELGPDDFERLNPVLDSAGEGVSLWIRRTEEWWRNRVFEGWEQDPYVYGVEREGELRGYVVYEIENDDGRTMRVRECNALDHEASLDLLRFLSYHDSQVERVRIRSRPDTLLFDLVDDPRALDYELTPGGMVRIVDVEAALAALDYPGMEGRLVLSVADPVADWNEGRFALDVRDGEATCTRVDEPADARVPITTLSQLFVGHCSVERATVAGDLAVESADAKPLLDELFPPREVCLSEGF
ncbi:GNAT family N-acetyltransferase [Halococcus hamelinensis]|uniref:Acetyltransferase n=1 Tax=Halococcus hamelinensis 100A6 TaxID=1132509 RepID=M0M5R3_9EURY|nr:GNAT family N-acetyltransferase [Halococcus hamelinensis]EMA39959.1 acetyltransferase [Halococcus hamelinensis 100A6]